MTLMLREHHDRLEIPLTVENVNVLKSEQIGEPPETHITFSGTSRADEDLYVPVSLDEVYRSLGYQPEPFQQAVQQLADLREPEKSAVTPLLPPTQLSAALYRRIHPAQDIVEYTGTGTAVREEGHWKIRKLAITLPDTWKKKKVVRASTLAPGVVRIDQLESRHPVTDLIDQQKQFISDLKKAFQDMETRLAREHAQLQEAIQVTRSWTTTITAASGRPEKIQFVFVGTGTDGQSSILVMINLNEPTQRSVWRASIQLVPVKPNQDSVMNAARLRHDGWIMTLKPVESSAVYPLTSVHNDLIIAPAATGLVTWLNRNEPQSLADAASIASVPSVDAMVLTVKQLTAPGSVLEGSFRLPDQKSERVRLTVTENRDQGQYVRAVLESLDEPALAVTLEGSAETMIESLYGQPIRLTRQKKHGFQVRTPLFTTYIEYSPITSFSFTIMSDSSVSVVGADLTLKPVERVTNFVPNRTQWETALVPGTRWSGKLSFEGAPQRSITMTIAETRDELSHVRVVVEDNELGTRCRVLEGTLNRSEDMIDGYALALKGIQPASEALVRNSESSRGALFGLHPDTHSFRLSPDGRTMIGVTDAGELIQLAPEKEKSLVPLTQEAAAASWRAKIVQGARWQGSLYNKTVDQKIDVELEITSNADAMGNFQASIRIVRGPKGQIDFQGVLRVENPINSNAFALDLKKLTPGVDSSSPVFGRSRDTHVYFRLGTREDVLLGYAGRDGRHGSEEVLQLVPVIKGASEASTERNRPGSITPGVQ